MPHSSSHAILYQTQTDFQFSVQDTFTIDRGKYKTWFMDEWNIWRVLLLVLWSSNARICFVVYEMQIASFFFLFFSARFIEDIFIILYHLWYKNLNVEKKFFLLIFQNLYPKILDSTFFLELFLYIIFITNKYNR